VTGARRSVKIFGCVEIHRGRFEYGRDGVFNADTYLNFLENGVARKYYRRGHPLFYIQDNASYHKDSRVWEWFAANRNWMEVFLLPPYSPEFNAAEPLWHHTRVHATHNTCFQNEEEIMNSLTQAFEDIQNNPNLIMGYLRPFQ